MKKEFTIITPTGDRPEAFELCKFYVERQSLKPCEWIIIDDGIEPLDLHLPGYVRRVRGGRETKHTLPLQMLKAMEYVKTNYVIVMEDDDWYSSDYCEMVMGLFNHSKNPLLVGQGQTVYYNVRTRRYHIHDNRKHASWCQTAFSSILIPFISKVCRIAKGRNYPYIDLIAWRMMTGPYNLLLDAKPFNIGMKAMSGRVGSVSGHFNSHGNNFLDDVDMIKLKEWMGEDYKHYERFYKWPLPERV